MVHNNKVLTVSYGTFSCTLEGFDDSFGTMKAIAEYFRDLSSDDRYFGSEPPQPDAEMLARIAQREIARQVEAHSTGTGGIVLRATDAVAAARQPLATPAPTPDVAPAPEVAAQVETPAKTLAEEAPVLAAEPVAPAVVTAEPIVDQQVSDTQGTPEQSEATEQAAQVETTEAIEVTPEQVQADQVQADDDLVDPGMAVAPEPPAEHPEPTPQIEAETVAPAASDDTPLPETDSVGDSASVSVADSVADSVASDLADNDPDNARDQTADADPQIPVAEDVHAAETVPAADSIAAKLQRIRAVVSQNDSLAPNDEYLEDEDSDDFASAQVRNINEAPKAVEAPTATAQQDDEDVADILDQLDAIAAQPDTIAAQPDGDSYDIDEDIFDDDTTDQDDGVFGDTGDESDDPADQTPPEDAASDTVSQDADESPVQARVVKVKRSDLEAAIATGQLEQFDDPVEAAAEIATETVAEVVTETAPEPTAAHAPEPATRFDSSLSPEDEDDLMRELAAVEEDLNFSQDDSEADDNIFGDDIVSEIEDADDQQDHDNTAHAALSQTVSEDEIDLSRLMEAADEKLDDPEISSQRDTYSHLRGAAAAAQAEKSAGGSLDDQTQDDAYRDDLASVVRPRRTAIQGDRPTRRVVDTRPAPLKLVAEQRVDEGTSLTQRGPVRPRRVMTTPQGIADASETTGADSAFAEFAARVGATELPELLEAAAAYLSFVEGQDKFSRPQLMNKVRLVKQDDYNREDGLRSFGKLLRDGKIEKRGGGRFAASVEIGFRPDEREAG